MKRKELERRLRGHGWRLLRTGRKHDVWTDGTSRLVVPRHAEINERTALRIIVRASEVRS